MLTTRIVAAEYDTFPGHLYGHVDKNVWPLGLI